MRKNFTCAPVSRTAQCFTLVVVAAVAATTALVGPASANHPVPYSGVTVIVAEADNGRTIDMQVGDLLRVELSPDTPGVRWLPPKVDRGLYIEEATVRADRTTSIVQAVDATQATTLRATTVAQCETHAQPCSYTRRTFELTVVVAAAAPTSSATPAAGDAASPSNTPDDSTPDDIVLGFEDYGRTVDAIVGQRLRVDLANSSGDKMVPPLQEPTVALGVFADRLDITHVSTVASYLITDMTSGSRILLVQDSRCSHIEPVCGSGSTSTWSVTVRAAASSPTPQPTPCVGVAAVSLAVSHPTITAGNAPVLSGTATKNQGAYPECHVSGTEVKISEQRYGETGLRPVATLQSRSDGTFEFPVRPVVQTTYIATAYGSSAKVSVQVHRRTDFTATGPTFAGRLLPAEAPIPVGLAYIQASGRYQYLGQAVSDPAGNFTITRPLPRGTFTYVVYTSPRQGLLRGTRAIRFTS